VVVVYFGAYQVSRHMLGEAEGT